MTKTLKYIFLVSIGLIILIGLFVLPGHGHFSWEEIPTFDALFGFIGCIIVGLGSKALGHYWLQRDEGYYND